MTISAYGSGAYRAARTSDLVTNRAQFDDLQRQLATGKKVETYGELGIKRGASLDLNARVSTLDAWLSGIELGQVNLTIQSTAVEQYAKLAATTRNDARTGTYVPTATGQTAPQLLATERFKQTIDLLNSEVNGRYLFSGRTSDTEPVSSFSLIMDGDGGSRAGLRDFINEWRDADLGADGLGRLTVGPESPTSFVVSEEPGNPFGFKLGSVQIQSDGITHTEATLPAPSLTFEVTAQPAAGDTVRIVLDLPDGSTTEIALTARAAGTTGQSETGFTIGADEQETADNLRASVQAALAKEAGTNLKAASAQVAAENFFAMPGDDPLDLPKRPAGPAPFTGATALVDATPADTVLWYKGETGTGSARATAGVQIDQGHSVATGARANEEAFRVGLAQFAIMTVSTFDAADPNAQAAYDAMVSRVQDRLGFGGAVQKPSEIIVELGSAQTSMAAATERHQATRNYLTGTLEGIENISKEEVAVQILALQTRMQASYQTTAMLSQLSLVNYI